MNPNNDPRIDLREALVNDCPAGPAPQIQLPREAVTRLGGLVVDLDANLLKPNPWFPPADTAETFYRGIARVLDEHPVLRHAEIRDTGRWLHAVVRFKEPVELKSAKDQRRWTALHKLLMGSVPADPSAPALIALTRPVGSVNGKTGRPVRTLQPGVEIPASVLTGWGEEVSRTPFQTLARVFFGDKRVEPCPYCEADGSHLDLGETVGFCYGPCQQIPVTRLHEPFLKTPGGPAPNTAVRPAAEADGPKTRKKRAAKANVAAAAAESPVVAVTQDTILEIDPDRVGSLTIRLKRPAARRKQ
jgi:hypothetical protein